MPSPLFSPAVITPADALRFWRGEPCLLTAQDDAWTVSHSGPNLSMSALQQATAARMLRTTLVLNAVSALGTGAVHTEASTLLAALSDESPPRLSSALSMQLAEAAGRAAARVLQIPMESSDSALLRDASLQRRFRCAGLRRFSGAGFAQGGPPLLLVPALINGAQLLHLGEGQSLAQSFTAQGFSLWLWDWQAGDAPARSLEEAVQALADGLQHLAAQLPSPPSVLGVCQGAWLSLWAAARLPAGALKQLFLAAVPGGRAAGPEQDPLGAWLPTLLPGVKPAVAADLLLPPGALNRGFLHLQPFRQRLLKYLQLALSDEADLPAFLRLEHWLFASPLLASRLQGECAARIWAEGGPDLGAVVSGLPLHWLLAARDHLVPAAAARAVAAQLLDTASVQAIEAGHIGLFVGRARQALAARVADLSRA